MKTLDEIKARHARELAEAIRSHEIAGQLPRPPKSVTFYMRGHPHISYEAASFKEALDIFGELERVPASIARAGCLSIQPPEWFKPGELDRADSVTDGFSGSALLTLEGDNRGGWGAELRGWIKLQSGEIAQVTVELERMNSASLPQQWRVSRRAPRYDHRGNLLEPGSWTPPNIYCDVPAIRWATGGPDHYCFSWFFMCTETFANEMARYLPKEQDASAEQ